MSRSCRWTPALFYVIYSFAGMRLEFCGFRSLGSSWQRSRTRHIHLLTVLQKSKIESFALNGRDRSSSEAQN